MTRVLRDDITLGRRAPGSRLVERDIAAELHVSRLPVREAIRALVSEGIVVARPRSWAIVREFTPRDIQQFAEVRESIETLIFVFAAERHDEAGLQRLREVLEREAQAARVGDVLAARAAAGEFHEVAAHLAGNEMLSELLSVFATRMRWLFGQYDDLNAMAADHRVIFDAIARRDADAVRTLLPRHLSIGREAAERLLVERSTSKG